MANIIQAVVTQDALRLWPQMFVGLKDFKPVLSFKIGEGGWVDNGAGPEPREPDPTLRRLDNDIQDLDSIVDETRAAPDQRYTEDGRFVFEKSFDPSDLTEVSPSGFKCRCLLDLAEANDDGFGNNPQFNEIGIFSDHPDFPGAQLLMVAYGTFSQEIKTSGRQLENMVIVYWSGT